jgi:hypothetical protein
MCEEAWMTFFIIQDDVAIPTQADACMEIATLTKSRKVHGTKNVRSR